MIFDENRLPADDSHEMSYLICDLRKGDKRGTFICAHAWIFFKLCILITHYIRTMKMYLSN